MLSRVGPLLPGLAIHHGLFAIVVEIDIEGGLSALVGAAAGLVLAAGVTPGEYLGRPVSGARDRYDQRVGRRAMTTDCVDHRPAPRLPHPGSHRVHACEESSMELDLDDPERLGHSTLADGRRLAWAEWGSPRGTPVVLCPGAAISRHLGISARAVAALGVRLISVDRPGLGASTPAPGRTLADFAADVGELVDLRGLGRPALIGNSQGAPFALACAAAGTTRALALVSASDEVAAPEVQEALPPHLRDLVHLVATDPDGATAVLRRFDAEAMWDLVMSGAPPSDRAVYCTRDFERAYRTALREGFAQGPEGYVRDTLLAMSRWAIPLAHIGIPVDIWYGEEDRSHSPDNGATLTGRIPGAHRTVVPDIGGAVLWTHARPILDTLVAHG